MFYKHELIHDDVQLQLRFDIFNTNYEYNPAHWHNHLEILFILSGTMTAQINEHKYNLSYHDILIINPKQIHSTQAQNSLCFVLLQMPLHELKRVLPNYDALRFHEYYAQKESDKESYQNLVDLMLKMSNIYTKKESGYPLLFTAFYYEFLHELYTRHTTLLTDPIHDREDKNIERIEQSMDYVKAHYQAPICLHDVAHTLSISEEYFCRLFKKYTGQTFLEYVNAIRLAHFFDDLIHSQNNITFLMDKHGITNYKVFIRVFKQTYGTTPSKIRRKLETEATF